MNKSLVESIYQPIFNFWVKKDGFSSGTTPFLAALSTLAVFFFGVGDVLFLINIFFDDPIRFPVNQGTLWLSLIFVSFVNYYLFFHIFKIEKSGKSSDFLFELEESRYRKVLYLIAIHITIFMLLAFISISVTG